MILNVSIFASYCITRIAERYVSEDPRGRDAGTLTATVKMGNEPGTFTGFFPSFDLNYKYNQD